MKQLSFVLTASALVFIGGCGDDNSEKKSETPKAKVATQPMQSKDRTTAPQQNTDPQQDLSVKPKIEKGDGTPPKELKTEDLVEGSGTEAKSGDTVVMQYVGADFKTGKQFDASWDRNQPFTFQLGAGMVIAGWDKGIVGMKVGGRRKLVIPPNLGYGAQGSPPVIAPNATLVFIVDLVKIS